MITRYQTNEMLSIWNETDKFNLRRTSAKQEISQPDYGVDQHDKQEWTNEIIIKLILIGKILKKMEMGIINLILVMGIIKL